MRKIGFALWLWYLIACAVPSALAAEPVLLVVDERAYAIEGLIGGTRMEPLPGDDRRQAWRPPAGSRTYDGAPVVIGGIPTVMGSNRILALRREELAPLAAAYGDADAVRAWLDPLLETALAAEGLEVARRHRARYVNAGVVGATPPRPEGQTAFALQMDGALPIVGLSWDNRRVLVSIVLKSYRRSRGDRVIERERSARVVRYASAPAPAGSDPIAYWADNGGARLRAEVERAFRTGLALALAPSWPDRGARPGRDETATVTLGGRSATWRGRIWKRDGEDVLLLHHDGSVTRLRGDGG